MNYDVIQPNSEIRACAREQLKGVWNGMAFTYFIYFLICLPYNFFTFMNSFLDSDTYFSIFLMDFFDRHMPYLVLFIPLIYNVLTIAMLLAVGPFTLGFAGFFLKRIRGEQIAVENIFDGFKRFSQGFSLWFFTTLFTGLWSLLLIIPGIVKGLGYSMAFNIMYDNPEIKSLEALKKSQIMMKGHKSDLLLLELSFIGWGILCLLTFGIGFFWLYPYINLSMANFYENLKIHQERNQTENQAVNRPKPPIDLFQAS